MGGKFKTSASLKYFLKLTKDTPGFGMHKNQGFFLSLLVCHTFAYEIGQKSQGTPFYSTINIENIQKENKLCYFITAA